MPSVRFCKGVFVMDELVRLKSILAEKLMLDEKALAPDLLFEDIGLDSLSILELIILIESEFDIEISEDEIAALKSLGELADLLMVKLQLRQVNIIG